MAKAIKGKSSAHAIFSGGSNSFVYIGDHVYAISGSQSFDGTETTVFEATTQAGYIVGKLTCMVEADGSDDIRIRLYYNGIQIMGDVSTSPPAVHDAQFNPLYLLIPPNTTVKITFDNEGSSDTKISFSMLEGKVYA